MKTVFISEDVVRPKNNFAISPDDSAKKQKAIPWEPQLLLCLLIILWIVLPGEILKFDPTAALLDQGIWLHIIISLIVFLLILYLCWWLLQTFWAVSGLNPLITIFSQFKTLALWQQYIFIGSCLYFLLFAALGCLVALC